MPSSLLPILARIPGYIMRGIAALLCILGLIYAAIFAFLQRDPQELADKYLGAIGAEYGIAFLAGSIDVTLLPLPAITLGNVLATGGNFTFSAARISAAPSFLALLRGRVFPREIIIERPSLNYMVNLPLHDLSACKKELDTLLKREAGGLPKLPGGIRVRISQLDASISGSDGYALDLKNSYANFRIRRSGRVTGDAAIGALTLLNGQNRTIISLDGAKADGKANYLNFANEPVSINTEGSVHWPGVFANLDFNAGYEGHAQGWNVLAAAGGSLDLEGCAVPFALKGGAIGFADEPDIHIRSVQWELDADSGSANMVLHWPGPLAQFALGGVATAHRLSLTQWLGFARNLAPGLQIALDNITNARLEFMLNAKSLAVPSLRATCSGATFTGSGGVANFARPVVALDITSPNANLGLGIPESVGEVPPPIFFPHPTLTPMPGSPPQPGEQGIGYDIRLAADLLRYGPLKIQKAKVRIYPGKVDKSGLEDVLLDGSARFYGGSVSGHCILGAHKSLPIYISGKASKVNGAPLGRDMPLLPMRKGIWNGNATVTTKGKQLHSFLGNMQGDLAVSASGAALAATGPKYTFESLGASGKLRSGAWNGRHLTLDGAWKGNASEKAFKASCALTGKLLFGDDGLTFAKLPGSLDLRLSQGPLPPNSLIKLSGTFSGSTSKNRLEAEGALLKLPGLDIHCDGTADAARQTVKGKLKTTAAHPEEALARLGIKAAHYPKNLQPVKISADYQAAENYIKLTKISGNLGKLTVAGTLEALLKCKKPEFITDLRLGRIVLADYMRPSAHSSGWDFKQLSSFDARGGVQCASMNIYGQELTSINVPFTLQRSKLEVPALTARFYGADMNGSLMADFNSGLAFDSLMKVNGFNLENAAKDRKLNIGLTGQASFQAALKAKVSGKDKLPGKLQGHWQFTVFNGSWQTPSKKGLDITRFKNASASGMIKDGVVSTSNFQLHGPELDIAGGGWYNIPSQNMECKLNVDLDGLPAFPLRLYGHTDNVKTSIGAGKMLVNAVGDVAKGFAGAVGGVIKGAWSIFRR